MVLLLDLQMASHPSKQLEQKYRLLSQSDGGNLTGAYTFVLFMTMQTVVFVSQSFCLYGSAIS